MKKMKTDKLSNTPLITIVTVTYFSSSYIGTLAHSLSKQTFTDFRWLIIDNSEDYREFEKLFRIVGKFLDQRKYQIIRNVNNGYAGGNNLGLSIAVRDGFEYVWILNPDVELPECAVWNMMKNYQSLGADVLVCKIKDSLKRDKLQYDGFKFSYIPFDDYPQEVHAAKFLSGSSIFSRSRVLFDVGFDERFFLYFEDNKLKKDLEEKGYSILYTPFVSIYHKNKEKEFLNSPFEVYYFFRNALLFYGYICKNLHMLNHFFMSIFDFYNAKFRSRRILQALIMGIYDGVKGVYGKKDFQRCFFEFSEEERKAIKKQFIRIINGLKFKEDNPIERFEKEKVYLLNYPKDAKVFFRFLKDSFLILSKEISDSGGIYGKS